MIDYPGVRNTCDVYMCECLLFVMMIIIFYTWRILTCVVPPSMMYIVIVYFSRVGETLVAVRRPLLMRSMCKVDYLSLFSFFFILTKNNLLEVNILLFSALVAIVNVLC